MNYLRRDLKVKSKQHSRARRSRGFSLVELMVALTLSTFLLGALIVTYVSGRAASGDAESLSRVQENMRFVSDHLLRDVRNAGFRDQLTLTFEEYIQIGEAYAEINGDELTIRYAGRSHCAQARQDFNEFRELTVIENTYFVEEGTSRLRCFGTTRDEATDLVDGVTGVSFEFIRPSGPDSGPTVCNYDTPSGLKDACTGVRITLRFAEVRPDDEREAVLTASFRNVLLDRIYGRGPQGTEGELGS